MSLQKAIEILEEYQGTIGMSGPINNGFKFALNLLKSNLTNIHSYQPSEDTQYKIDLTAWIERKARYNWVEPESPYSLFETWQKVCARTTEEGEG